MHDELAEQFNAWLDQHFEPDRTRKGRIRRRGVKIYPKPVQRELRTLLGGAYPMDAVRRARSGEEVSPQLQSAIRRVLELEDPEAIRARVRDERLADALRHARRIHEISGSAPDGGNLQAWATLRLRRLNDSFETTAPIGGEAAELWGEIMEVPEANQQRLARRGG